MTHDTLERYRRGTGPLPATHKVWPLYGAGFENLGQDGQPIELPLPSYGPDEILVRQDAVGLCFSDLKVISAGQSHPRVYDDMRTRPVILGHEIALTVVGVGANRQRDFRVGDRFVVQADVIYKGRKLAIGYALPGGLQQYNVLGKEVLDGDEGCYLLPLRPEQGYAEAALSEPWACVEASYVIAYRRGLKAGGAAWFVGTPAAGAHYTLSQGFDAQSHPAVVVLTDVPSGLGGWLRARAGELGVRALELDGLAPDAYPQAAAAAGVQAFDDLVLLGPHCAGSITAAMSLVATGGALILASAEPLPELAPVDVGRLHYDHILLGGTAGPDVAAGYRPFEPELPAGGVVWCIGGGGPMGHMHIQRALEFGPRGPRRVIASDLLAERLAVVQSKFGPLARRRGVDLTCLVEPEFTPEAFQARMDALTGGRGPDYIVVLAPVASAVARAYALLAPGGILNVFAGLNRGTLATLDLNAVRDGRQLRIVGSSGSAITDLQRVLDRSLDGSLSPEQALAAVTGLEGAREGLEGMAQQRFPGKVVVYPQAVGLPVTTLGEMPQRMPEVAARLAEGPVWTNEAEEELLRRYVARDT
jgi:threonine dehydrogenase-like Zn-dependent dehydrogenase